MCPSEQRFLLLFTFLKKNQNKKVMVFFSSCNSVKFHSELLNYIDIAVMDIHVSSVTIATRAMRGGGELESGKGGRVLGDLGE